MIPEPTILADMLNCLHVSRRAELLISWVQYSGARRSVEIDFHSAGDAHVSSAILGSVFRFLGQQ
jgi:hypothetical protein